MGKAPASEQTIRRFLHRTARECNLQVRIHKVTIGAAYLSKYELVPRGTEKSRGSAL